MSDKKSVLFVVQHPAHVHQFKHVISQLNAYEHLVYVMAIDKEITISLLNDLKIDYKLLSKSKDGLIRKISDVIPQIFELRRFIKNNNIDVIVSRGNIACCFCSGLFKTKHIVFSDSEPVFIDRFLIKMATMVITPDIFRKDYGKKHKRVKSYKEFSYLHPDYYKPDDSILAKLDLEYGEPYFILRFVAWKANHDLGEVGLSVSDKLDIVEKLSRKGKVFISSEKELPSEFESHRFPLRSSKMHDALAFASMFVGDSQTMTTEAAILGTPAIRINSFVGKNDMANFIELENKYDLIYNFKNYNKSVGKIDELLSIVELKDKWKMKSDKLINDKVDLNKYMIDKILSI